MAHVPRIYIDLELASAKQINLLADASHHLTRVLRLGCGDNIKLFDGYGHEYFAKIIEQNKKETIVLVEEAIQNESESFFKIHLAQALTSSEKMDFIIQKAVELGVTEITPIKTKFCKVNYSEERLKKRYQHWQKIIINACEQCGRSVLPTLNSALSFEEILNENQQQQIFLLHPYEASSLKNFTDKPKSILLMIGPEGGFADVEVNFAKQKQAKLLSLGPRILRMETAAVSAISTMQFYFGDM